MLNIKERKRKYRENGCIKKDKQKKGEIERLGRQKESRQTIQGI